MKKPNLLIICDSLKDSLGYQLPLKSKITIHVGRSEFERIKKMSIQQVQEWIKSK